MHIIYAGEEGCALFAPIQKKLDEDGVVFTFKFKFTFAFKFKFVEFIFVRSAVDVVHN